MDIVVKKEYALKLSEVEKDSVIRELERVLWDKENQDRYPELYILKQTLTEMESYISH